MPYGKGNFPGIVTKSILLKQFAGALSHKPSSYIVRPLIDAFAGLGLLGLLRNATGLRVFKIHCQRESSDMHTG